MNKFRVWISRLDGASGLRVDGLENTHWLLRRLSELFVFKTCEPLRKVFDSPDCTFRVAHTSQMSGSSFERLLAGIPEVKVVLELVPPALKIS